MILIWLITGIYIFGLFKCIYNNPEAYVYIKHDDRSKLHAFLSQTHQTYIYLFTYSYLNNRLYKHTDFTNVSGNQQFTVLA